MKISLNLKFVFTAALVLGTAVTAFGEDEILEPGIFIMSKSGISAPIRSQGSETGSYSDSGCDSVLEKIKSDLRNEISDDSRGIVRKKFPQGIDYACKKIVFSPVTTLVSQPKSPGSARKVDRFNVSVTVSCIPRNLAEKQLYSFSKSCESQPVPACFDEAILKRLEAVRPMTTATQSSDECSYFKVGVD